MVCALKPYFLLCATVAFQWSILLCYARTTTTMTPIPPIPPDPTQKAMERKDIFAYVEEMTSDILKDVNLRYEHAMRYIEMHKGSANFELGFIAASAHQKFSEMISQYKRFSEPQNYQDKNEREHYQSLEIVEGLYNEILHERRMFYKTLEDIEEAKKTTQDPNIIALKQMMNAGMSVDPKILNKYGLGGEEDQRRHLAGWRSGVTPSLMIKNAAYGHTLSDFEFKKNLRFEAFERRRANFTPELEGIDVDLTDIL